MAKYHRQAKKSGGDTPFVNEETETYVMVNSTLGCGRFEGSDTAGKTVRLKVKGSLYKRAWITKGSICLASSRPGMGGTLDIIYVYQPDEVKMLKRYGEIEKTFDSKGVCDTADDTDMDVVFSDDVDDDARIANI